MENYSIGQPLPVCGLIWFKDRLIIINWIFEILISLDKHNNFFKRNYAYIYIYFFFQKWAEKGIAHGGGGARVLSRANLNHDGMCRSKDEEEYSTN